MPDHRVPSSYREAGVDIDRADRFVEFVRNIQSPAMGGSVGEFGAAVELPSAPYRRPLLVSTTDGVGTKILVAKALGDYSTIGIDLVAMSVNDLAVCGVKPLSFLDYIACGSIDQTVLEQVIAGIVRGCEIAGCSLSGGETAEMPDLYGETDIDLAGFCTGIVEADELLPKRAEVRPGARLFGLASSGVHSNGLSLARKAIPEGETELRAELLRPTRIYVNELLALIDSGAVLAAAHVTGGGLVENLRRVIPKGLEPVIQWDWPVPKIFTHIQSRAAIDAEEMRRVFNMGIGAVLVTPADREADLRRRAEDRSIALISVGTLRDG
jgi:phosphoribosylformylglycinamidine cyclo-ligase